MTKLTPTDYKLIEILQKNARCSIKCMAEQVHLTPPAVASRIERLEKLNIIQGYHADINEYLMGYHITSFISLQVAPAEKAIFASYIDTLPNVVECNCVTGNYSMLIKALFRTTMELDAFVGDLQKYGRTYTQIVFSNTVRHRGLGYEYESNDQK